MTPLFWIRMAAGFMLTGVIAGAFGAHALKNSLSDPLKIVFETGVRYQLIHGLALLAIAWLTDRMSQNAVQRAGWAFTAGIVIFSGSLYALALTGTPTWGAVTPLGGLAFLFGWGWLLFALKNRSA